MFDFLAKLISRKPAAAPERAARGVRIVAIGNTEPNCPNCGTTLKTFPLRKISCPTCGRPIYSRTRPFDEKKTLLTEEQAHEVETQWAALTGTLDVLLQQRSREQEAYEDLTKQFKRAPSKADVQWRLCNEDLITQAKDLDYSNYRGTLLTMAGIVEREKRYAQAAGFYCTIVYFDLNGATSGILVNGVREPGYCDPEASDMLDGIVGRMMDCLAKANLQETAAETLFYANTTTYRQWPGFSVSPEVTWDRLRNRMRELAQTN